MKLFDFTNKVIADDATISFEDFNFLMKKNQNPLFNEYVGLNATGLGVTGFLDTVLEPEDNEYQNKQDTNDQDTQNTDDNQNGVIISDTQVNDDPVSDITPTDPNI